jgi:hypothetical protein
MFSASELEGVLDESAIVLRGKAAVRKLEEFVKIVSSVSW